MPESPKPWPGPAEDAPVRRLTPEEKVVRSFIRDDRLVSIPAKPSKRDLLLPIIRDRAFVEDREYEEKEVNMRLALLHSDVAALRRYLVDGGWMTREKGIYRKARGPGEGPASSSASGESPEPPSAPESPAG